MEGYFLSPQDILPIRTARKRASSKCTTQSRRLNSACVMPRTKKPPFHFEEISSGFWDRFGATSGEAGPPCPSFGSLSCSLVLEDIGLESVLIWTIEGKGRSGREAGNDELRFGASLALGVGSDLEDLGLRGDGRKAANEEVNSVEVGDKVSVLDIIDE